MAPHGASSIGSEAQRTWRRRRGMATAGVALSLGTLGLVAVAAPAGAVTGTQLYVTTSGTNAGNTTCAQAAPCATISYALTVATAGATVNVGPGTFAGQVVLPNFDVSLVGSTAGTTVVTSSSATASTLQATHPVDDAISYLDVVNSGSGGSVLLGSAAGNGGAFSLTSSTVSGDGTGVTVQFGSAAIADTTIADNATTGLSAVVSATVAVDDTTVADNGGDGLDAQGGATVTVASSTVNGNQGLGFGPAPGAPNSNESTVSLSAVILSNNFLGDCAAPVNTLSGESPLMTDAGFNLADDATCVFPPSSTSRNSLSADLGALAANGGPTETFLPPATSPEINAVPAGSSACPDGSTDQRGIARPTGDACDIGSVEVTGGAVGPVCAVPGTASTTATLPAGTDLAIGQVLRSPNGAYTLTMQTDGNLVEYLGTRAVFNTRTMHNPGSCAVMQTDGNLVVYSPTNVALYNTHTAGHPGATVTLGNDSQLIVSSGTSPLFTTGVTGDGLAVGGTLVATQELLDPSATYNLVMQTDGNLVEYRGTVAVFNTKTFGHPGSYAVMQSDGNFVVYSSASRGTALFNTHTSGHPGAIITLLSTGNLVITLNGKVLYADNA